MQNEVQKPKKRAKWPFVLLIVLLLIVGAAVYIYQNYLANNRWKPLLQQQLKALVLRSSDSLYHLEYADFDLNVNTGDATLKNVKLVPDSAVYQKLIGLKKAPDNLFTLSVKKLSIKNFGAKKAYREKILNIGAILIEAPSLTIVHQRFKFNDTVKVGKPKTPYELIKKVFKQLRIDSISLKNISAKYINKTAGSSKTTTLKHLDISISDVSVDSLSATDTNRFYYTKGVSLKLHNYSVKTPDSLYLVNLKQFYFSTAQRRIILDKVSLLPRYSKKDFYQQTGEAADRFSLQFKTIAINDIDLQRFLRDQILYAGTMDIAHSSVDIYNNNAYKGRKTSKIGKDPHQSLQKVALDMQLKRLNIYDTDISYAETDATTGATGKILFNNTNGYILNVTNDDDVKKVNPFMVAHIRTRFMNAANLSVNFKFNLKAQNGAFNYSGTLGKFDGRILDRLVKPLALVHVQSADVKRLDFNVDASNYGAKGHLEFYYNNLNIQLLKKEKGKTELQKQGFISTLANTLIINNDNPTHKGVFNEGPINIKREPTVSFFSFLYKALLDGLKPSVGYNKKTENKVNKAIVKVSRLVDKIKQYKANKRKKKEDRQKARQAKRDASEQKLTN